MKADTEKTDLEWLCDHWHNTVSGKYLRDLFIQEQSRIGGDPVELVKGWRKLHEDRLAKKMGVKKP